MNDWQVSPDVSALWTDDNTTLKINYGYKNTNESMCDLRSAH